MPKLTKKVPSYRHHRPSGQAVVVIGGRITYLGPWRSKASKVEYDRLIGEWLAAGRPETQVDSDGITVMELLNRYLKFAATYYVPHENDRGADEIYCVKAAIRLVKQHYGRNNATEYGPLALKATQKRMIDAGMSRGTINRHVHRIRRIWKWGASEQLILVTAYQALLTVSGLRSGRTEARETEPVRPVADATVEATLPHLPDVVADMVRLQRLTGARPGEICAVRPIDVDTSKPIWEYRLMRHKTAHRGKQRVIFIGPHGQDILRPYLLRAAESHCFSPRESEQKRLAELHEARKTPIGYGNSPGTNRKAKPKQSAGDRYTVDSYRRAIGRACEVAFGMPAELRRKPKGATAEQIKSLRKQAAAWRAENCWNPHQLRHTAATAIRQRFGVEQTRIVLGHSDLATTEIYAERDYEKARHVMANVG